MKSRQQRFGKVLRRRREAIGLSQEALESRAQLHRKYVGLLERGQRMPSLLVIRRLAKALGASMAEVVGEIKQPGKEL